MRSFGVLVCLALSACTRAEPPAGSADPPPPVIAAPAKPSKPKTASPSSAAPSVSGRPVALVEKDASPPEPSAPALLDDAGKPLPQTEDRPKLDSAWFRSRAEKLFQSIVKDDPDSSLEFFFPLVAYRAVKDVADPARDYKFRLIANFKRDIHDYHEQLGARASEARFVGVDMPENEAKWMKPHSEGNKLGYYRVLRSRLRYETADGKQASLEITSFISWRGEWYLVHLHGFK